PQLTDPLRALLRCTRWNPGVVTAEDSLQLLKTGPHVWLSICSLLFQTDIKSGQECRRNLGIYARTIKVVHRTFEGLGSGVVLHHVKRCPRPSDSPSRFKKPVQQDPLLHSSAARSLVEGGRRRQCNKVDAVPPKIFHIQRK